jgi:hypothetical protein
MLNGVIVGNKVEQQKATATHSTHSEAIEKSGRVAPDTCPPDLDFTRVQGPVLAGDPYL